MMGEKEAMEMTFGEAIKEKRERLGLTQQDLAEKLFASRQTVCRWENGTRCPDLIMAKKISMVLGISMDELVPGEAVQEYTPPKEAPVDISCVKVMLAGMMTLLIGTFLYVADHDNMDISAFCFVAGILIFLVGLFIPMQKGRPVVNDQLPQKKCPKCGKNHDFDYPKCPHCEYDYLAK